MGLLALRNLWDHKLRSLLLGAAVIAGVSFVVASFVFTDSLAVGFSSIFEGATEGIDIVVSPPGGDGSGDPFDQPRLPAALAEEIRAVDGIQEVRPNIEGFITILSEDGESQSQGFGPPTFGLSWPESNAFLEIADGLAPDGAGQAVMDAGSATNLELDVGDTIDVVGSGPIQTFALSGVFTVGGSDQPLGPTFVAFDFDVAAQLLGFDDEVSGFDISIEPGADLTEAVARVANVAGDRAEVVDARAQAEQEAADLQEGLGFFNTFLLVFAAISLVVGAFVVYNAFRVVVSQRSKELAMLRILGTTRRQLVVSVLAEAGVVGVIASILGVVAGVALAVFIRWLLGELGNSFPDDGLVIGVRTVVVGLVVGIVTTLLSALIPSLRTASIAPMEALRDQPNLRPRRRWWDVVGIALLIASVIACVKAVSDATQGGAISGETGPITLAGIGALGCFVAVVVLSRSLVRPMIGVLGLPSRSTETTLARENSRRSPRRTATTATALTIGLGLVASVAVMAESVESTIINSLDEAFAADLVIQSSSFGGFGGFPPELSDVVSAVEGVEAVSPINAVNVDFGDGTSVLALGVVPESVGLAIAFEDVEGSLEDLRGDTIAIQRIESERLDVRLGDGLQMTASGEQVDLKVVAIFDLAGEVSDGQSYYLPYDRVAELQASPTDLQLSVSLADPAALDEGKAAVEAALTDYPTVDVLDEEDILGQIRGLLTALVGMVAGLLMMSLLVAVVGIVLTLYLAVIERTRETGLLRAVGMTRRQVRRMIRREAVLIAIFGTILGLSLGLFLGWVLAVSIVGEGVSFSIPWGWVVGALVASFVAGVVASIIPARHAARMDVLAAIAYE